MKTVTYDETKWVMVPKEPTPEMQTAGGIAVKFDTAAINKLWTANKVYEAMLSAASQLQEEQKRKK